MQGLVSRLALVLEVSQYAARQGCGAGLFNAAYYYIQVAGLYNDCDALAL